MMEWFRSGGFGMFAVLAIGAGAIGFGIKAVLAPSADRVAALRSLPWLILTSALFGFGTGMWAVNQHLSSDAFLKARDITAPDRAFVALMGLTEAVQPLTLGALLAMIVLALRMVTEAKLARESKG
jgi:hypothetical protein